MHRAAKASRTHQTRHPHLHGTGADAIVEGGATPRWALKAADSNT